MGAASQAEDDIFELAGMLILLALVVLVFAGIFAWNKIAIPEGAYPYPIFSRFASWIDGIFFGVPEDMKPMFKPVQGGVDWSLGGLGNWINEHLPQTPSERSSLAQSKANSPGGEGSGVEDYDAVPDVQAGNGEEER